MNQESRASNIKAGRRVEVHIAFTPPQEMRYGVVGIELCRSGWQGLLVEFSLAEVLKNRYRRRPVEVRMVETDWTVTMTANAKIREASPRREGKKRKPVVKYEEGYEEEERGDDLFAVNLSPRKPDDLMSPYSMRMYENVLWR